MTAALFMFFFVGMVKLNVGGISSEMLVPIIGMSQYLKVFSGPIVLHGIMNKMDKKSKNITIAKKKIWYNLY